MKKIAMFLTLALMLTVTLSGASLAGSCSSRSQPDIVATAVEAGSFNTLVAAVKAAGLVEALQGEGPFTVFAPTDEAFAKLPEGTLDSLLLPENKDKLTAILTYHVVSGSIYSSDARPGDVATLEGSELRVSSRNGNLMVDQAQVVATDIEASNGVIHVIDEVILPEMLRASGAHPGEELIRMAIERGSRLYNAGQPDACTAVYEVAAQGLISSGEMGLTAHDRHTLQTAMARVRATHGARDQAWIMRHALDEVMTSLSQADDRMARM